MDEMRKIYLEIKICGNGWSGAVLDITMNTQPNLKTNLPTKPRFQKTKNGYIYNELMHYTFVVVNYQ